MELKKGENLLCVYGTSLRIKSIIRVNKNSYKVEGFDLIYKDTLKEKTTHKRYHTYGGTQFYVENKENLDKLTKEVQLRKEFIITGKFEKTKTEIKEILKKCPEINKVKILKDIIKEIEEEK